MPTDREVHEAAEAHSILSNPILAEAFSAFRMEALMALEDVDATNVAEVQRLQAEARCIQSVVDRLQSLILRVQDTGHSLNEE